MGYRILNIDSKLVERYTVRDGEPPLFFENGRVLYYDRKSGNYYDAMTDIFVTYEEHTKLMREQFGGL